MHRSDAYYSTSYSQGIRWLPSPEVCRMITTLVSNVIKPLRFFFFFFVLHTCEIIFHDVIDQSTVHMYSYAKILNMADLHGQMSMFWTHIYIFFFFFQIRWIQLCDKKNLTCVNCCDKIL